MGCFMATRQEIAHRGDGRTGRGRRSKPGLFCGKAPLLYVDTTSKRSWPADPDVFDMRRFFARLSIFAISLYAPGTPSGNSR